MAHVHRQSYKGREHHAVFKNGLPVDVSISTANLQQQKGVPWSFRDGDDSALDPSDGKLQPLTDAMDIYFVRDSNAQAVLEHFTGKKVTWFFFFF